MNRLQILSLICIFVGFFLAWTMLCSRPIWRTTMNLALGVVMILTGIGGTLHSVGWHRTALIPVAPAAVIALLILVFSIAWLFDRKKPSR